MHKINMNQGGQNETCHVVETSRQQDTEIQDFVIK